MIFPYVVLFKFFVEETEETTTYKDISRSTYMKTGFP